MTAAKLSSNQLLRITENWNLPVPKQVLPLGNGLIHQTWKLETGKGDFVLQQVNNRVFQQPEHITENIEKLRLHLESHQPGYFFVAPLADQQRRTLLKTPVGYFRLFPFVAGSHAFDHVSSADQAWQAARQFGRFTRMLSDLDVMTLKTTLPDFHNLSLRQQQFETARGSADPIRLQKAALWIEKANSFSGIVNKYEALVTDKDFHLRVTHHDTKISNVLFNEAGKAICVIDLDTVMPGYFISDLGDMMRTYLSEATEEEQDLNKISVRPEIYQAVLEGYAQEMGDLLTDTELAAASYSGEFMIYMQALRFLTDYLNHDTYYGSRYPDHNLNRAANQFTLLERYYELAL